MKKLDLSTVLASAIHESKNHVGNLLFQLQSLKPHVEGTTGMGVVQQIEEGLKQINDEWVEYLYLYRLSSNGYELHYDCWSVEEFLDDQVFALQPAAAAKQLDLSFSVDASLVGVFDERLMTAVISTAVYNALRFAKTTIELSAEREGDFLIIHVDDDGQGFVSTTSAKAHHDDDTSHTGLGLYFAELAANAHRTQEKHGLIKRGQAPKLGGARLSIYLPQ